MFLQNFPFFVRDNATGLCRLGDDSLVHTEEEQHADVRQAASLNIADGDLIQNMWNHAESCLRPSGIQHISQFRNT